jgi:hypothetical protein
MHTADELGGAVRSARSGRRSRAQATGRRRPTCHHRAVPPRRHRPRRGRPAADERRCVRSRRPGDDPRSGRPRPRSTKPRTSAPFRLPCRARSAWSRHARPCRRRLRRTRRAAADSRGRAAAGSTRRHPRRRAGGHSTWPSGGHARHRGPRAGGCPLGVRSIATRRAAAATGRPDPPPLGASRVLRTVLADHRREARVALGPRPGDRPWPTSAPTSEWDTRPTRRRGPLATRGRTGARAVAGRLAIA